MEDDNQGRPDANGLKRVEISKICVTCRAIN